MLKKSLMEDTYQKILVITSSGGGGLLQTANARTQQVLLKNPDIEIVRIDLLRDWIWKPVGLLLINVWNRAQSGGSIPVLAFCVWGQSIFDKIVHPIIFFYALFTLFRETPDHIIDTQPMCSSAIVKALRIYNWRKKKSVRLEKVLVDLPTKKATHFFRPIKKLSSKNRKLVLLTTIEPLLEKGETEEAFWQETCGLSAKDINLEDVYVRRSFLHYKNKLKPVDPLPIKIRYESMEELFTIRGSYEKGPIQAKESPHELEFIIEPEDKMITILLGSQPAKEATFKYVQRLAQMAREFPRAVIHIFAFCARYQNAKNSLFQNVASIASSFKEYPLNLSIIPFSFQKEDVIAPLFHRSDACCTRTGGQTAMELICVSTGQMWVHSEAKPGQDLLEGMPVWESASAVYLQKRRGAKIITPDTMEIVAREVLHSGEKDLHSASRVASTA